MATLGKKAPEPEPQPKEQPKDAQQVLEGSIDDRMKALREDHIAMGARAKGDHYKPRA